MTKSWDVSGDFHRPALTTDRLDCLVGRLAAVILLAGLSACSGVIKIERLPSPTPLPPPPSPAAIAAVPPPAGSPPHRIVADKISLDAPVVEMDWTVREEGGQPVSIWNVPENAAGWHINSAPPGQGGNVVISGHNNSTGGRVFSRLDSLDVGDRLMIWTNGDTAYPYQISEVQIVRAFGASQESLAYLHEIMQPTPTERLTLITCWPAWTNTHRLIIIAQPLFKNQ